MKRKVCSLHSWNFSNILGQFQELELEKKKVRCVKKTFQGPTIKFVSTSTPEISAVEIEKSEVSQDMETSSAEELVFL